MALGMENRTNKDEIGEDGVYKMKRNPFDRTKGETVQENADRLVREFITKKAHGFGKDPSQYTGNEKIVPKDRFGAEMQKFLDEDNERRKAA